MTTFASLGVPTALVEVLAADGKTEAFPIQADTLTDTLDEHDVPAPGWLDGLVAHLAARHCPSRAASMLAVLERLLLDSETNRPERASGR